MKKVVDISLAGRTFVVEEEVFHMVGQYTQSLRMHFRNEDPEEEIVADLEERMAELFDGYRAEGYEVISEPMAREVIEQLGQVEQILDAAESNPTADATHKQKEENKQSEGKKWNFQEQYHLYRNPQDKWVAGVFGGLKYRLGVDPIVLRLLFIILLCTPVGWPFFLIYLAYSLFVPQALTVEQRLEMEGREVTPETIWQKIKEERSNSVGGNATGTSTTAPQEAEQAVGKQRKRHSWLWWSLVVLLFLALVASAIYWIVWYSDGGWGIPFWEWQEGWPEPFSGAYAWGIALFVLAVLVLVALVLGVVFICTVLPIGLVLRSSASPLVKVLLILLWFGFFGWIFFM